MTRPVLYDYWRSSASYRVRIALNLKGVDHVSHPVDLLTEQQRSDDHVARNPQGLVPALAIDGHMLTQSLAIIDYLDARHPEPALLPADPLGRARVHALCHAIAMDIHPVCNMSVVTHVVALAGGDAAVRPAWMQRYIARGLAAIAALVDRDFPGDGFLTGAGPGLFECCLVPQLYNARRWEVALDGWPRLSAIDRACAAVPAFQAAHPDAVRPSA